MLRKSAADPSPIGVLALQGAFAAHAEVLAALAETAVAVRTPADLDGVRALIVPGGESSTMSMLLQSSGLFDELTARVREGLPIFGTCAGMILLAGEVLDGRPDQRSLGAIDIAVRRNAYGRQVDSFEADLTVRGGSFRAVFIRAPRVESAGPDVEVLAVHDGHPVLLKQGNVIVASFHPELSGDGSIHRIFVEEMIGRDGEGGSPDRRDPVEAATGGR